mgnify:CR=1 FL=1
MQKKNRCCGCGKVFSPSIINRLMEPYCKECMKCENNEYDYHKIIEDICAWFSYNLIPLEQNYSIRMRWSSKSLVRKPVRVKGGFFHPRFILGRSTVSRDSLPLHIVYACLRFWMSEMNGYYSKKVSRMRFIKLQCVEYTDTVLYWYMLAYLYDREENEQAERLLDWINENDKRKKDLEKLCAKFALHEDKGTKGMLAWLDHHPLKTSLSAGQ